MSPLAAVQFGDLLEVVWVSAVATIGTTATFSVVIVAGARAAEARRTGRKRAATAWTVLGVAAFAAVLLAVVLGVHVMTSK